MDVFPKIAKPTDPYDPLWVVFNAQNPHLLRSVGAAAADGEGGGEGGDNDDDNGGDENKDKDKSSGADNGDKDKDKSKDGGDSKDKKNDEMVPKSELARVLADLRKVKDKKKEADRAREEAEQQLKDILGDLTPDEIKQALADRAKAEEERLKAEQDWEALKDRLVGEHKKQIDALNGKFGKEVKTLKEQLETANKQVRTLLVSNAFASSKFLNESLTLTPSKAEKLYGDHFKVEEKDGRAHVVAYFKGQPLVDAEGNPLPFDEAFKEIVNADPEKDSILKSNAKPGAGSKPADGSGKDLPKDEPRGLARIQAALGSKKA